MNLASKLGEDLARTDEILLTEAAFQQMTDGRYPWEAIEVSVSGVTLSAYKVMLLRSLNLK
jgi:adenylate cyclase